MRKGSDGIIEKKEREQERLKEKVESLEQMFMESLKETWRNEELRQKMAKECWEGIEGKNQSPSPAFSTDSNGKVTYKENFNNENNVPTGEEEKYWEK